MQIGWLFLIEMSAIDKLNSHRLYFKKVNLAKFFKELVLRTFSYKNVNVISTDELNSAKF